MNIIMNLEAARDVLKQPLVFGDPQQISAVRTVELNEPDEAQGQHKYRVHVTITGDYVVDVMAEDEAEAKELATEDWREEAEVYAYKVEKL